MPYKKSVFIGAALLAMLAPVHAQVETSVDPNVILQSAAEQLSSAESFSVSANVAHDVVVGDNVSVTMFSTHDAKVDRPNKAEFVSSSENSSDRRVIFNSGELSVINDEQKMFAAADTGPTVDDGISFALETLDISTPLVMLARTDLADRLRTQFSEITYIGRVDLAGIEHDQLLMSNEAVDVQLWISTKDKPTLGRMNIVYNDSPGTPRLTAQFMNWDFSPQFEAETFSFLQSESFERIDFLPPSQDQEQQQ